jgi:hypothetical protein
LPHLQARCIRFRKYPIVKLRFTIELRAHYRRSQKSLIFAAPLGARTRSARLKGVFSVGKAAKKTDFIKTN